MKISVIAARELDASLVDRWKSFQSSNPELRSPYYRPEFAQRVAGCGRDVRVAVMEADGQVQGFFPYEMGSWGCLQTVGGGLNDYHGAIVQNGFIWRPTDLLRATGGRYFAFNHMPLSQKAFAPFVRIEHVSPTMDLTGGWEAYGQRLAAVQQKKTAGIFASIRNSVKRIERDVGPLRFEMYETSPAVLDTVLRLKTEQRKRLGSLADDPFALAWVRQLMADLLACTDTGFRGALCALHAGDKLAACHFGMQSGSTLHYWFPVYETAFAVYQPGMIMLLRLAQDGSQTGIDLIDLGSGLQDYKARVSTGFIPLGEGAVSRPAMIATSLMTARKVSIKLRQNPALRRLRDQIRKGSATSAK